ncbi:hypothetical protein K490DRAFT_17443, partial [Saccharata proteae CBS 121410]
RPPRPPSRAHTCPIIRPFTHNSQLRLVVSPSAPRPQLPFLHSTTRALKYGPTGGQWQIARLLTTEQRRRVKDTVWLAGKYTVFIWIGGFMLFVASYGVWQQLQEWDTPTPHEWSLFCRSFYRSAQAAEDPAFDARGFTDWVVVGPLWRTVMRELESTLLEEGKELREHQTRPSFASNVDSTCFDLTDKSEPWRRGYFEVLMGCARSAQNLTESILDITTHICWPKVCMVGPSNPNPRPVPPNVDDPPPLEEHCVPTFDRPEKFYVKILTSKGFNTEQRLEAAIAYGDWLNSENLSSEAEEAYRWGLDIATSAIPNVGAIIDTRTSVIHSEGASTAVSTNIVNAATALATHYARSANVDAALPIFLSILRARRAAPPSDDYPSASSAPSDNIMDKMLRLLVQPPYPPPPPSLDLPLRRTADSQYKEAVLMMYIGEILFATSPPSRETGLAWTRKAAQLAEGGIDDPQLARQDRIMCVQCLETALENWEKMAAVLAREERVRRAEAAQGW